MSDLMLLDVDPAISLRQRMAIAADGLDFDAQALAEPLAEASELLGSAVPDATTGIRRAAADLRSNAEDLHKRIQMVLAGGREMNAGLAALERIRASFTLIETRGHSDRADGKLSRRDLEWARHQLDEETSAAAGWLADHDDFFARVETAKDNDSYINKPYDNRFAYDPEDSDGVMRIEDIDAFVAKTEAWATLLPHARVIDTAHRGGKPDGVLSRNDFEAFLNDYDIPPEVARAVHRVLDDGAHHKFTSPVKWGTVLDVLSFVPVVGDVVDGARSIHYALHGDWQSAGIYALGLVPLPGLSGSGIKAGVTVVKGAVNTVKKHGYKKAARETGTVLRKGTLYNWTANTAAESLGDSASCSATYGWIAQQAGVDIARIDRDLRKTTGEDIGSIKNRLSDATGHNLGAMDGFFSDTCEVVAQRLGEHKLSKLWLRK